MRSKSKTLLLGAAVALVFGSIAWPGCVTPPLPSSRKPISSRNIKDFELIRSERATRSEVIQKFGNPNAYLPDVRVACYLVNSVTRRKLWLFLGVIPINVERTYGEFDIAYIQFDENDRVVRLGMQIGYGNTKSLEFSARRWLASKPKDQRKD